jgi:hypothetical protein
VSLLVLLRALFDTGHVRVPHPDQHEPGEDLHAASEFLSQYEHSWRLEFPGEAPAFHVPAAIWAATMLYRAVQAAVYRQIPEPILRDGLSLACPSTPNEAARHYSVDLLFRFLPDLVVLAHHASPDDPLLQVLQTWANQWPLSSVGMKGVEPAGVAAIASHAGLLQLYVDRILAREDFSRLADPRVQTAVRESVGAYAELSPALAKHLQKHE